MPDVPAFDLIDWFEFKARGQWIAHVKCDRERDRNNPGLTGEEVLIDGRRYTVLGVERALPLYPIRKGEIIGLLVADKEGEDAPA